MMMTPHNTHVLMVNNLFTGLGGGEVMMLEEAKGLEAIGCKVDFFCTDKPPYVKEYPNSHYFTKHEYPSLSNMLNKAGVTIYNRQAERDLTRMLHDIKPDVVHFHGLEANLSAAVIDACHKAGVPSVWTLHDPGFACPASTLMKSDGSYCHEEHCRGEDTSACIKFKCARGKLAHSVLLAMEAKIRRWDKLYDKVDYYLCPSESIRQFALRAGKPASKLILLANCVSSSYLDKPISLEHEGYFLYVGRLETYKGCQVLLKALTLNPNLRLKVVGSGSLGDELIQLAKDLGIEQQIEFMGRKTGEELFNLYQKCLALVVPSIWFEAFGLINLEAMSYGKPVICSNSGGMPEIVIHGETGLVVEMNNPQALADAMGILHNNPDLAATYGANGWKRLNTDYLPKDHVQRLLAAYQKAILRYPSRLAMK